MRAHQLLYYTGRSVWSDYNYDLFCKKHGLDGNGGGGDERDYTSEENALALEFIKNPNLWFD